MMLTPEEPATEKAERHYQKNFDVVRVVFDEDFAIGEGIQQGLATGANQHFTFGRYECGLHLGQRSIDRTGRRTEALNHADLRRLVRHHPL